MTNSQNDSSTTQMAISDISREVTTKFLDTLIENGVPPSVVERLAGVLRGEKKVTRQALTDAMFEEAGS